MHCIVWVPNLDGQKTLADEKPNLISLLDYNIQARVNFSVSPHIWIKRKNYEFVSFTCRDKNQQKLEYLNVKLKYLAGIIALKSSPEGQSFNFSRAVSPFFTFCRSASNKGITKNEDTAGVLLYSVKILLVTLTCLCKTSHIKEGIIKSEIQEKTQNKLNQARNQLCCLVS